MLAANVGALPSPASLENPNSRLVIIGHILSVLVPLIIWFAPLPLELETKHCFAIVGFMIVAWITRPWNLP